MAEVFTKPSRRIQNMIAKELRLIVKDRVALFLIFLLPAVSIGMLYYVTQENDLSGMGGGPGEIEGTEQFTGGPILGLIDLDTTRTYEGEDLSANFTGYLEELAEQLIFYTNEADAYQDMYDKEIMGYVVIPDGFERNLTLNEPTYVTVHVDATNFIEQSTVMGVVQGASIMFRGLHLWIESEVFPAMMIEFMPTVHWIVPVVGIVGLLIGLAIVTKRVREDYFVEEFVTTAEPESPGLEPGMVVAVEYKIREGKVVFGVVIRNGSENAMQNVQVILGVPDLTDSIRSEAIGTVEAGAMNVVEIEFELQPGAEGELVGMVEYDSVEGEHRVVNLRPVKIVA